MREVIRIEKKEENEKPVEFTHRLDISDGWLETIRKTNIFDKIVYLGNCSYDGDMFACYVETGEISIYKGHLNSGKYE